MPKLVQHHAGEEYDERQDVYDQSGPAAADQSFRICRIRIALPPFVTDESEQQEKREMDCELDPSHAEKVH